MGVFRKVKSLFNNKNHKLFEAGCKKMQQNDYRGAIKNFNMILQEDVFFEAYYHRAVAYLKLEQYNVAMQDYDRAIELNPNSSESFLGLGIIYTKLNHPQEAIHFFSRCLTLNTEDSIAYTNRGYNKLKLDDYLSALDDFDKALDINPLNALAYSNRGVALFKLGNLQDARDNWEVASELGLTEAQEMLKKHKNEFSKI
jgi:tetratricopeptide (TPR) repeat protein